MKESILPLFLILLLTIEIDGSASILKRKQTQERCHRMQEIQRCPGAPSSWHFDVRVSECRQSNEEECGSIGNRFQSKEDCEKICVGSLNISARQYNYPHRQQYQVPGRTWPLDYCNRHCCGQQRPVVQPIRTPCYGGHNCPQYQPQYQPQVQPQVQPQPPCHGSHCQDCSHRCPYPCPPPIIQPPPPPPPPPPTSPPCPVQPCPTINCGNPCSHQCTQTQPCPTRHCTDRCNGQTANICPQPCQGNHCCGSQTGNNCQPCPNGQHCPDCNGHNGHHDVPEYEPYRATFKSSCPSNLHCPTVCSSSRLSPELKNRCCGCRTGTLVRPRCQTHNRCDCRSCNSTTVTPPLPPTRQEPIIGIPAIPGEPGQSGLSGLHGRPGLPGIVCPIDDPRVTCGLNCENGYKKTEAGCPYCECEESAVTDHIVYATRLLRQVFQTRTFGRYCTNIRATCRLHCPLGFARDRYGCPICQCLQKGQAAAPVDCSLKPSCTMFCEHGFQKGPDGCDICLCSHTSTA